jgi:hypothetical protein
MIAEKIGTANERESNLELLVATTSVSGLFRGVRQFRGLLVFLCALGPDLCEKIDLTARPPQGLYNALQRNRFGWRQTWYRRPMRFGM